MSQGPQQFPAPSSGDLQQLVSAVSGLESTCDKIFRLLGPEECGPDGVVTWRSIEGAYRVPVIIGEQNRAEAPNGDLLDLANASLHPADNATVLPDFLIQIGLGAGRIEILIGALDPNITIHRNDDPGSGKSSSRVLLYDSAEHVGPSGRDFHKLMVELYEVHAALQHHYEDLIRWHPNAGNDIE